MAKRARTQPGAQIETAKTVNPFDDLQVFYEKYKQPLNTIVTIVLIGAVVVFAYFKMYMGPREDKAATAMSYPQRYFQFDSLNLALNGDGAHAGFLRIEKKYSGTKSANLCHLYAGTCYLQMSDFNNAVRQLKDFDGKGTILAYRAWGLMGDAYMEMGNVKKGIEYYKKASDNDKDQVNTPTYLYRLGVAYETDNQAEEAKKAYMRLRDNFPQSPQARDMPKLLARLGVID